MEAANHLDDRRNDPDNISKRFEETVDSSFPHSGYNLSIFVAVQIQLQNMPGLVNQSSTEFKDIKIKKLHSTFGAEISGVDFSSPVSDEIFNEILAAVANVS